MKKSFWFVLVIVLIGSLALAACGGSGGSSSSGNTSPGTIVKNRQNPPSDYANVKNPDSGNADAVSKGKDVYTSNCETCHGTGGHGDGPSAASLNPKPADLTYTAKEASDQYIHWVVSEGGAAAGLSSAMPSFKGTLSDDQIWQVVNYVKSLK